MSEQDFPQRLEEGDAEEALTLDPNFIFDRGEEENVDRDSPTCPCRRRKCHACDCTN